MHEKPGGRSFPQAVAIALTFALLLPHAAASGPMPPPKLEPKLGGVLGMPKEQDPKLPEKPTPHLFPPGLKSTWLAALEHEDADLELRYRVIEAFAAAHEYGLPELDEVPPRLVTLLKENPEKKIRWAAAEALVRFDHHEAAGELLAASVEAPQLSTVVDPGLVRWDHEPARAQWRQRIEDGTLPLGVRRSAARSLGKVGDGEASGVLRRLVMSDEVPVSLRLDAAEALGRAVDSGLVEVAGTLAQGEALHRTLAGSMLRSHASDAALDVLRELARDADAGVASVAVRSLGHASARAVFEMRDELSGHDAPNVRYYLVDALLRVPEIDAVGTAGQLLDDPSRAVRWRAREVLIEHGQREGLWAVARAVIDRAVAVHGPRGQEQAALAAGKLEHTDAAMALAGLLESEHWRVRRAAANAMHELAAPETLPAIYGRLARLTDWVAGGAVRAGDRTIRDEKLALIMALGVMRYAEADEMLRRYVPKTSPFGSQTRAAAVWTLGQIHRDNVDEALARQLLARMTDTESLEPEADNVRHYAAIALGLMGAEKAVPTLDEKREAGGGYQLSLAFRWAAERITGESRPSIEPPARRPQWFLEPLED